MTIIRLADKLFHLFNVLLFTVLVQCGDKVVKSWDDNTVHAVRLFNCGWQGNDTLS